jgi:hypothetical protein
MSNHANTTQNALRLFLVTTFILAYFYSTGQTTKATFKLVDGIILSENYSTVLSTKLDSVKSKFNPSKTNFSIKFDRDIDFGYKHKRIELRLNFEDFQIDLLAKNDTIYARTIQHYYSFDDREDGILNFDSSFTLGKVNEYLSIRNRFYRSNKTIADLLKELSEYKMYAFYCGDALPITDQGEYIQKLVEEKNVDKLFEMLQSISVETQACGVVGLSMLKKKGVRLTPETIKIVKYIKKRNSETVSCSGCFRGIILKIYSTK